MLVTKTEKKDILTILLSIILIYYYYKHIVKNLNKLFNHLLENVAAFSFNILSSFLNFNIVSLTMLFSFSYLLFKFVSATSAVFLFDLSTVLKVAICSRLAESKAFNLITCSCKSATSTLFSFTDPVICNNRVKRNCYK